MAAPAVADKADNAFMMICTALVLFIDYSGDRPVLRRVDSRQKRAVDADPGDGRHLHWSVSVGGLRLLAGVLVRADNFFGNINWLMLKNIELTAVMGSIYQYIHVAFQGCLPASPSA